MIVLSDDLIRRCGAYGKRAVSGFARGDYPESAALTVRGADKNVLLWTEAKMAECVFALEHNLDPLTCVKWTEGAEFDGIDVIVGRTTVDVKTTKPGNKLLIWSVGKPGKLERKDLLHVLVLTPCSLESKGGESIGWITRKDFIVRHQTAAAQNQFNLDIGTPYMHMDDLKKMSVFPGSYGGVPFEHYCWCGDWGAFGYRFGAAYYCQEHKPAAP